MNVHDASHNATALPTGNIGAVTVIDHLAHAGHRIALHHYPADTDRAIVMLPAMGVPAGYYKRFAPLLVEAGIDVTIMDLRGTGASTPLPKRGIDYGYADLVGDLAATLDALAPRLAGSRVTLVGHSLGGHIATLYLASHPTPPVDITSLVLVASGVPHHRHYGAYGPFLYSFAGGASALSAAIGHWPGKTFGGRQSHGVIRDWAHTVHKGMFVDVEGSTNGLSQITTPVLAITVDNDRFTPPSTARHLTNMLPSAPVTTFHYGADATDAPLNHFAWAKDGAAIAEQIRRFLSD